MQNKEVATIPEFNHSTINQVLEINRNLIQILTEYQNNGWYGQEYKIYYQRLQTNLQFLGIIADSLPRKSHDSKPKADQLIRENTGAKLPFQAGLNLKGITRRDIITSLPAPTMVYVEGKSIPPFVGTNPQQELSYSGLKIVDEDTARDLMTSTIGKNTKQVVAWSSDKSDSESEDKKDDTETDVEEKKDFLWNPPPIDIDNQWINHNWDIPVFDSLSNNNDLDNLFSEFDL